MRLAQNTHSPPVVFTHAIPRPPKSKMVKMVENAEEFNTLKKGDKPVRPPSLSADNMLAHAHIFIDWVGCPRRVPWVQVFGEKAKTLSAWDLCVGGCARRDDV